MLLLLSLVGCLAEVEPASLPGDHLPPPLSPVLNVSPLISGADVTMIVTNAPPGSTVWFLLSTRGEGPGPCHPVYGDCIDLLDPVIRLIHRTADAGGNASVTRRVPPTFDNRLVWFQALVTQAPSSSGTSAVVERLIGDDDLDYVYDANDNCQGLYNPAPQTDADGDSYGAACDCDDNNPGMNPATPDPTIDGIDQNCDGYDGPPFEWTGTYEGTVDFNFNVFGTPTLCSGPVEIDVDALADPQIDGTVQCTVQTAVGPLFVPFTLTGEIDLGSLADGYLDDGGGSVLIWDGAFGGAPPSRTLSGTSTGALLLFGNYTMSFTATEL